MESGLRLHDKATGNTALIRKPVCRNNIRLTIPNMSGIICLEEDLDDRLVQLMQDITDVLNSKSDKGHHHTPNDIDGLEIYVKNVISETPPKPHTHPISEVVNLQTNLNNKSDVGHKHAMSDINGLETSITNINNNMNNGLNNKLSLTGGTMTGTINSTTSRNYQFTVSNKKAYWQCDGSTLKLIIE